MLVLALGTSVLVAMAISWAMLWNRDAMIHGDATEDFTQSLERTASCKPNPISKD